MRFARSRYLLSNYRHLQRYVDELRDDPQRQPPAQSEQTRTKRSFDTAAENSVAAAPAMADMFNIAVHRSHHPTSKRQRFFDGTLDLKRVSRHTPIGPAAAIFRQQRVPFQGEQAFDQYMQKIRQRYKAYVKNILGYNGPVRIGPVTAPATAPAILPEIRAAERQFEADLFKDIIDGGQHNAHAGARQKAKYTSNRQQPLETAYSALPSYASNHYQTVANGALHKSAKPLPRPMSTATDYIAALQSQLMRRRKRDTSEAATDEGEQTRSQRLTGRKNGRRNLNATTTTVMPIAAAETAAAAAADGGDSEVGADGQIRGKPKSPCLVSEDIST